MYMNVVFSPRGKNNIGGKTVGPHLARRPGNRVLFFSPGQVDTADSSTITQLFFPPVPWTRCGPPGFERFLPDGRVPLTQKYQYFTRFIKVFRYFCPMAASL